LARIVSIDDLLTQTATVTHKARTGALDRYNVSAVEETTESGVPVLVQPTEPREVIVGRETYIIELRAFFMPDAVLDGSDEFTVNGHTYEVVGPPEAHPHPRNAGATHHLEVDVREVI
jgi:hypothetical protein